MRYHYYNKRICEFASGPSNNVQNYLWVTPPTTGTRMDVLLWAAFYATAEFTVEIYEGTVTSNDGTLQTTINGNRKGTRAPSLQMYSAPTVTTPGTLIWSSRLVQNISSQMALMPDSNLVLADNTKYLLRLTRITAGSQAVDVYVRFDEETTT
jgi:hypothetical protein